MDHEQAALTRDQFISNSLILLIVPTLLFLIFKHRLIFSSASKNPPLPPGPKPWPVVGNLLQVGKSAHITLAELAKSHGPLISLKLGAQPLVVASSPEAASEVLRTHDRRLSARYVTRIMRIEGVDLARVSLNWAPTCGERWKLLRSLCRAELLSPRAVESQAALRRSKAAEMVEFLARREGRAVEVKQAVSVAVFNIMSNLFFSKDMVGFENVESGNYGLKGLIDKLMELGTRPNLAEYFPWLDVFYHHGLYKECLKYLSLVYAGWEEIIKERREKSIRGFDEIKKRDFLDAMLEREFEDDQINRLTIELFTAGIDTTGTTVEWAMTELIRNKEAMDRVREELIAAKFNRNSADSESMLSELPYLNACFKETLRLHPPAPLLLPHFAPEACELMGYTVPKNSPVFVNVWAIGRDPAIWDEALVFKPERFLGSDLDFKGFDFEFLPFGSGRRICPGMTMGSKQVALILANLIHCFDWSLPDGQSSEDLDMSDKLGITLQKKQPLLLIPKIRF